MPPTTASKLKQRARLSDAFISRVSNVLNHKMFIRFLAIKNEINVNADKKVKKLNTHLKWYPLLRNKIVGIDAKSDVLQLTGDVVVVAGGCLSTTTAALVVLHPPQRFTSDILLGIIPFLPYPAIGRLAQTCKWMNGNITQEQADNAVKRGRELTRRITLFTEPSGRQMLRFFSVEEEEPIEFGRILEGSQVFFIRFRNRTFMGTHPSLTYSLGLGEFFATIVEAIESTAGMIGDTGAWFKVVSVYDSKYGSKDCLHIRITARSDKFKWRLVSGVSTVENFDVGFHEWK
jgi:hypothetical protein